MLTVILYAIIGVFLSVLINYLSDVLPYTRKLSKPVCQNCARPFRFNNYLFSFRCPNCHQKSPLRVKLVPVFTIAACVLLYFFPFGNLSFWETLPIILFLGVVMVIDIEHRAVLIETSIIGIVLFLVYGIMMRGWSQSVPVFGVSMQGWLITLLGGLAGFLFMYLLYLFGKLFTKVLGKIRHQEIDEVALGFGDVYVCTFMGLLTGWPGTIGVVLIAILLSGVFSVLFLLITSLFGKYRSLTAFPYAPFLIIAGIALFYL
jgi:prepilin signal peptidase PulO-like enzyme (type II secretory pathway)